MQKVSSNGETGKAIYRMLIGEAHIQAYAEFPRRLAFQDHRQVWGTLDDDGLKTPTTSKKCSKFYTRSSD
jgi:hypothetical protein